MIPKICKKTPHPLKAKLLLLLKQIPNVPFTGAHLSNSLKSNCSSSLYKLNPIGRSVSVLSVGSF